jgi:hypothetical protein
MYLKTIVILLFVCSAHGVSASDERFSTWTKDMVAQAQSEVASVDSSDAARLWAFRNVMPLYNEVFPPYLIGIGVIEPGPYNLMLRVWDDEDFAVIDKSFVKMTGLLNSVRKRVGGDFPDAKQHMEQLTVYREKLHQLSLIETQYERELRDSFK